jgi:hypothetical protein
MAKIGLGAAIREKENHFFEKINIPEDAVAKAERCFTKYPRN